MAEEGRVASQPKVYSIAAHRGFADALVAGLVPRYSDPELGLSKLTLLLPSSRARRTVSEAFIRHAGEEGRAGLLMPRMAVVGDLDLDEALGPLLDPLGTSDIPPAIDPQRRMFALARLIAEEMGDEAPRGATLLRLARETGATMDRLLVEDVGPEQLRDEKVAGIFPDLSGHWQDSIRLFANVQAHWLAWLGSEGMLDAAARRNRLFDKARKAWKANPPKTPVVAAGVTSAAPALAKLLRVVSELPQGALILPDFYLTMDEDVWDELGRAGAAPTPEDTAFARDDAVTHPQYHLKLLLNRMSVRREEVQPWHRKGMTAAPPERSHAISALFLPPEASKAWVELKPEKRRLSGVRIMQSANREEEAQAIALLVRKALSEPEKRVAVVTPDRPLARRVVHHLARWNIVADDSAGRPLSHTPAGRAFLLAAEVMAEGARAVPLMALLGHPLADGGMERGRWLRRLRVLERALRGPRLAPGLEPARAEIDRIAEKRPEMAEWWAVAEKAVLPLVEVDRDTPAGLAAMIDTLASSAEALCGEQLWAQEDGRTLAGFVEEFRLHAREAGFTVAPRDIAQVLADAMEERAVRPPYGGHARVQVLGLLEARMNRADLVICAGLNEGVWPARGSVDALLAPPVLRTLGVPGGDFRIGLSAHDLAGAMGAPEVVLSRSERDEGGPAIPSRFLLRVQALLGDLLRNYEDHETIALARAMTRAEAAPDYPRPMPNPGPQQRNVDISATALDRLLGDPYQFFAQKIMGLSDLDELDADPNPLWQGNVAHEILERWHKAKTDDPAARIAPIMEQVLDEENADALVRGLWQPRLQKALEWIEETVNAYSGREVLAVEVKGSMHFDDVFVHGRADRIDRLEDGSLGIIDYKTGKPPTAKMVEQGYALQLGILGLIAEDNGFKDITGEPGGYEYWSLGRAKDDNPHGFGYVDIPLKVGKKQTGLLPEDFLPTTRKKLTEAIDRYIKGDAPFTARANPDYPAYDTYDQLMRLEEWLPRQADEGGAS
ncbi:double-strand break repair protein AddB [Qipengyuania gelatinilytica]|uniref:Double-strand break repair protein AddB n=1 Tax=Qipengyuania gelatinilytica TaxID=2867231 RepID=A0ABX9A323_9SPHN|nr:double-strand break repair protein AddB [Qipengyuania gelatinilytica]QZD95666.1 double-strand break repair protein AddB [Qipengyuania gelatinilytica]